MIRIAIVEDEASYAEELTGYLKEYEEREGEEISITTFRDGDEITQKYRPEYDIILMDIQMRFMDGMSAAKEIRKVDEEVVIIFITNNSQYAIRGYEVGAMDYIVKPISSFAFSERLKRAITKIKRRGSNMVTIPVRGGVVRVDPQAIYYVESQGHNLIYHTSNGDYTTAGTMKSAEENLLKFHFSRGNKCYLINLGHVDGVKDKCAIVHRQELLLSRAKQGVFMQELTEYWGT